MIRHPSVLALAVAGLVALSAVACSTAADDDGAANAPGATHPGESQSGEPDPAAVEDELRASCNNPREYFVTFREGSGSCEPIPARNGQWLPEPLFADAPSDVQATTCAYRWAGARYSRPDRDAITAKVGVANGLAPACGTSTTPDVGLLHPIPAIDILAQAGSVGCDVCGVLRRGKLWVILPPEKIAQRQFQVLLDNGETRAFQIAGTSARALSITLPAPPAGTRYQAGRVHIY
jgi:hypothetical protein